MVTGADAQRTASRRGAPASSRTIILLAAAVVGIGQGFARFTFGLLLPAMAEDLIGSYSRAGWLGTANLVAYLAGMVVVSVSSSWTAPTTVVRVSLGGTVAGLLLLAFAPTFPVLVVGMLFSGGCAAGLWVPLSGMVSGVTGVRERGTALGIVVSGVGIGILAAGQLVGVVRAVSGEGSWRAVWAIEGVIGLVVLLLVVRLMHPDLPAGGSQTTVRPSALLAVPRWWAITGVYTVFGFGYSLYVNYLVAALEGDAGFSSGHAARVFSLLGLTSIFGGVVFGRWSDRVGRRAALLVAVALVTACSLAVPLGAEPWAALSAGAFGLAMTGVGTIVSAVVSDHLDPRAVGAAFGTVTVVYGVSQASAPYAGGWLAEEQGSFVAVFLVAAVAFAVGITFAWFVPRQTRRLAATVRRTSRPGRGSASAPPSS